MSTKCSNLTVKCVPVLKWLKGTLMIYLYPFSTMTRFHIHSAYYLMILYPFRNLYGD
ncbi:hypothetical protein E2C01_066654 [Portunus trituberculatus]|uniref:Uncharacterized protein n=1 Tax=Portunus trituberculatus TaxID=210409 RepID=A0A5B7HHQ0_PORTR|nr:hypothetical protein [Portunus trituberculatus]